MANENALITESRRRLQHLRSMPATPMRMREIQALERTIVAALASPTGSANTTPGIRGRNRVLKGLDRGDEDDEPEEVAKPKREVQRVGTHRRIIVRRQTEEPTDDGRQMREEQSERKRIASEIKGTFGGQFRGMS